MKNKIIEGIVTEVSFPNKSVIIDEENKLAFKGGILGQKVELKKVRRNKGKLLKVLEKSPLETEANCPHSEVCGGCTYQNMSYEEEIKYKNNLINKLFKEDLNIEEVELVPSPVYKEYRNKMEYTFSDEYKDGPLGLGLHMKNRFYEVVNTDFCNIIHEDFNKIRSFTKEYFDGKIAPYNKVRHTGHLRHLVIRRTSLGEILINLVTVSGTEGLEEYFEKLKELELIGNIVSILHTENDSLSDAVVPEKVNLIYGVDYIMEEIHGLKFKVSPFSFFQTNTYSASMLYKLGQEMLGDLTGKVLLDLYSGTGTITQILGRDAEKALGIEIVEEAVESARKNAKLNGLENVEFIADDVFEAVKDLEGNFDIIVLDPPREGINPRAIDKIISFAPEKFLYISCNPVTFTRDLKSFLEAGYKIENLKAVDQFPRTNHLECVTILSKVDN